MGEMDSSQAAVERVQALFLRHSSLLRGFVRALLPDAVRADDVLQETFLTISRKAADFDPATSFPKWACAVARYKVMEERRRMGRASGLLSAEAMEALAVSEEAVSIDPRVEFLAGCMKQLPESMRRLIELRYRDDHTPAEVAERVGWSPNAVYVGLSRARGMLRDCLQSRPSIG
jgi:RNA polymerase sigma-70 factor, ECF subfamily